MGSCSTTLDTWEDLPQGSHIGHVSSSDSLAHEGEAVATIRTAVETPVLWNGQIFGDVHTVSFTGLTDDLDHVAVLFRTETVRQSTPLVRIHSECLTGDTLFSASCDCGPQLKASFGRLIEAGGVLLYLRQEGRGIGLYNKLDAMALQSRGVDTVQANVELGFPIDARRYDCAADMLTALGIQAVNLLTNNPKKVQGLIDCGISVRERFSLGGFENPVNARYLSTKTERLGHKF